MAEPDWKLELKDNNNPVPESSKFLKRWPKHMDAFSTWTIKEKNPADKEQPKIKQVHAFLQSHSDVEDTSHTSVNNNHVYAIIGCGFSATVNRASLSKEVRRGHQVVHIGYPDPWSGYVTHNMNQAVELLTLPGYLNQPEIDMSYEATKPQNRWLTSKKFSECTRIERERFKTSSRKKECHYALGVTTIKKENKHFIITLNDDQKTVVKAANIDILTGVGQQRILKPPKGDNDVYGIQMSKALWMNYLTPGKMGETWTPRVVSAEMYVRRGCKPKEGGTFCITGASPASIQAMEHALLHDGEGNYPDSPGVDSMNGGLMVNSGKCNDGFLPIGRLDYHAKTVAGEPLPMPRLNTPSGDICPTIDNVWFGEGYRIKSIEDYADKHCALFEAISKSKHKEHIEAKKLLVTFRRNTRYMPRLIDKDNNDGGDLKYGLFDQVILSSGRLRGKEEVGSTLGLVSDFERQLQPITSDNGFHVGLTCHNSNGSQLRILGAAGINNPIFTGYNKYNVFSRYEASLPVHARVNGEGVTLSAHTVAWANEFYTKDSRGESVLNTNINTATLSELRLVCEKAGLSIGSANTVANMIYQARRRRIAPFISTDQTLVILEIFKSFKYFKGEQVRDIKGAKELMVNFCLIRKKERELKAFNKQHKSVLNSIDESDEKVAQKKLKEELGILIKTKKKIDKEIVDDMKQGTLDIINNDELMFKHKYSETVPSNKCKAIKPELPECIRNNWLSLRDDQIKGIKKFVFTPTFYLSSNSGKPTATPQN